jgi:hypothetical protein
LVKLLSGSLVLAVARVLRVIQEDLLKTGKFRDKASFRRGLLFYIKNINKNGKIDKDLWLG